MSMRYRRRRRRRRYSSPVTTATWRRDTTGAVTTIGTGDSSITNGALFTILDPGTDVMRVRGTIEVAGILRDSSDNPATNDMAALLFAVGVVDDGMPQSSYEEGRATTWRRFRRLCVSGYPAILQSKLPRLVVRPDQSLKLVVWQAHLSGTDDIRVCWAFRGWKQETQI